MGAVSDLESVRPAVVVAGGGLAGLCAAIAAHDEGARVVLLERAPETERGGNTRFSGGLFRATYRGQEDLGALIRDQGGSAVEADAYSAEMYHADIQKSTGGTADRDLSAVLVDQSLSALRWLAGIGVGFAYNLDIGGLATPDGTVKLPAGAALIAEGEGAGLVESLFTAIAARQIPVAYGAEVLHPNYDESGGLASVSVSLSGRRVGVPCHALIVACGGFQANPIWRTAFLGPALSVVKVRGTRYNTGELLLALTSQGAAGAGDWSSAHVAPVDAGAPDFGDVAAGHTTNRLSFPYSVTLDLDGRRFIDEGEDFNLYRYVQMGKSLLERRGRIAIQVFDGQTLDLLEPRYRTATPISAPTLDGLFGKIAEEHPEWSFNCSVALATIEEFNCATQSGEFRSDLLDGKRTVGLNPDKTNWALPLVQPPFVAYPVTAGITFTFGGLRTDALGRVLNAGDEPLPGLYGAGEVVGGFFAGNYPGGASLTRSAVFGRICGVGAATAVKARPDTDSVAV